MFVLIPLGVAVNILLALNSSSTPVMSVLSMTSFKYLLIASVLGFMPWPMHSLRIFIWSRFLGNSNITIFDAFRIVLGCEVGAALSPTAVGGGPVKLGMLVKKGMSPGRATSLTVLGSFEDTLFFLLAVPFGLLLTFSTNEALFQRIINQVSLPGKYISILLFSAGILFLTATIFRKMASRITWLGKTLDSVRKIYTDYISVYKEIGKRGKALFCLTILLTAVQWICRYSVITALLACFDVPLIPVTFFLLQWVVFTLTTLVPTPGGSGGAEAVFYFAYSVLIPGEIIGLVIVSWRFFTYYLQLLVSSALLFVFGLKFFSADKEIIASV